MSVLRAQRPFFDGFIDEAVVCAGASKAVCVGRNYAAHARELSNPEPTAPVLFVKTQNCIVPLSNGISLPKGLPIEQSDCHHELELVLVIGERLSAQTYRPGRALSMMQGIALGLDLTLRSVQSALKANALPWARAKCFDGAAPITHAVKLNAQAPLKSLNNLHLQLAVNGAVRQAGHLSDLIFDAERLVDEIVQFMTLEPGDLIFTGTPAGVGPLVSGDELTLSLWFGGRDEAFNNARALMIEATALVH